MTTRFNTFPDRFAFTLIELLIVMGLMAVMMIAGMAGYRGMRRGAELRGAESLVRSTLMLARQQAVTKKQGVDVYFLKNSGISSLKIFTGTNQVHGESFLPFAIEFDTLPTPNPIKFGPAGSAGMLPEVTITLKEKAGMGDSLGSVSITVWPLTGVTQ